MNKNEKPSLWRGKGAAVGIVICFVAVIAMVGAYTFNNYQKQIDEQVAKAEQQAEELTKEQKKLPQMILYCRRQKRRHRNQKRKQQKNSFQWKMIHRQRRMKLLQKSRRLQEIIHQVYGSAKTVFLNGLQAVRSLWDTVWIRPYSFRLLSSTNIIPR